MTRDVINPWPAEPVRRGGPEYARRHAAHRLLQDRLTGAAMPPKLETEVAQRLDELNELLAAHQVSEHERYDGMRAELPGRGHPLLPPFVIDETVVNSSTDPTSDGTGESGPVGSMRGRVTFTRFHLGGGAAVHGGVQPLLFDDVMGRAANRGLSRPARTAYLRVDYRQITPLNVELFWEVTLERVAGRKRFVTGRLTDAGGALLANAESLFVELLPGQP